ncbi:hypothetical protein HGA91_05250 [candidate division WWE3 bacterium]|nr:hypothetical protein [candidate division WWE3 bacterium]
MAKQTLISNIAIWLIAPIVVGLIRGANIFADLFELFAALLGYFLVGLLSGLVLVRIRKTINSKWENWFFIGGYVIAIPLTFLGTIIAPLFWGQISKFGIPNEVIFGVIYPITIGVVGSIPIICCCWVGKMLGRFLATP